MNALKIGVYSIKRMLMWSITRHFVDRRVKIGIYSTRRVSTMRIRDEGIAARNLLDGCIGK